MPSRSDGPDDDRAGADPREVRLRSARLLLAGAALIACPRFEHWFDNPEGPSSDISLPGLPGRALYTEATREYAPGRQAPAHFQSRCLIRLSINSLDEALRKTVRKQPAAPPALSLRLSTEAGELIVPLQGTYRTATAPTEGATAQVREAAMRGDSGEHRPRNRVWN